MLDYRSEDCEKWARRHLGTLSAQERATLIEIKPKPPQQVLGGVRMPSGMVWPNPPWHYHFAVLFNGRMYDEAYPDGLPEEEYKDRFQHRSFIDFRERAL